MIFVDESRQNESQGWGCSDKMQEETMVCASDCQQILQEYIKQAVAKFDKIIICQSNHLSSTKQQFESVLLMFTHFFSPFQLQYFRPEIIILPFYTYPFSQIIINIIITSHLIMNSLANFLEHSLPAKRTQFFGKDGLMNSALPYLLLPAIQMYSVFAIQNHAWSIAFIAYTLLPFFDEFFTYDLRNPTEEERKNLEKSDFKFRLCLYATIAIDWYLFFKVMNYVSNFEFTFWNAYNMVALFYGFSNINSMGFMIGHEIFHKPSLFDRVLGTVHMSKNLYMHFTYEHLYGHHRRVATPEDPASAEQGIDVYRFFWRSFTGSYKSVYEMQREEKKPLYSNYAVLSVVGAIAFTAMIYLVYGLNVTLFFFAEAVFSIFYFEAINYAEHYGLRRKKLANGEYEKVTIRHSWNAPQRFTNYLLYKVQRHSDHHQNSLKPYQTLLSLDESPHLPLGYTAMIMIAMFPSVWYEVMNPLVEEYKKYEIGTIKTEITEKSHAVARQFIIKLSIFIVFMWSLTFFKF